VELLENRMCLVVQLLKWKIVTIVEIFTLPEAVEWFDISALDTQPVALETETLRELNRAHLLRMGDKAISGLYGFADAAIGQMIKLHIDDAVTLPELDKVIRPFFAPKPCKGEHAHAMGKIATHIPEASRRKSWEEFVAYLQEHTALQGDALTLPLRRLMTGRNQEGIALEKLYPLIQSYLMEVARCPHSS